MKVNIHAITLDAITLDAQISNTNDSEIGIVIKDHRDIIIKMFSETIKISL